MQLVEYEFDINRDIEFVFENIYKADIYRIWASAFAEDFHYIGELKEGAKIRFLDINGNGVGGKVAKIIPNEHLEFLLDYELREGKQVPNEIPINEAHFFTINKDGSTHIKVTTTNADEENLKMLHEKWAIASKSIIKIFKSL